MNLLEDKEGLSKTEYILIMLITLVATISQDFYITIFSFLVIIFFISFYIKFRESKYFRDKIDKLTNLLFITFFVVYFIDAFSTWLGVFYYKNAFETNELLVFLWQNFGVWFGWAIYTLIIFIFLLGFLALKHSKLLIMRVFIFFVMAFINLRTLFAIISNFFIIFG
jgi:hypothetical protein